MKRRSLKILFLLGSAFIISACGSTSSITSYTLVPAEVTQNTKTHAGSLLVSETLASNALDRSSMLYQDDDNTLMEYQKSEWVNAPAKLITPLLLDHFSKVKLFEHVINESIAAHTDYRLDTQLLDFYHDVRGDNNRVKVLLTATLIDTDEQKILLTKNYEVLRAVAERNASSSVVAYNLVLSEIFSQMTMDIDQALLLEK